MAEQLSKLECSDMSCSEANLLRGVIGYNPDPAQITSPVKRTPMAEAPVDDSFHRTFQPFDMLRSPSSLGGHSFQGLNAHLAQNARLSTRQRSLRHALRTATKEYVPPEEPTLLGASILLAFTFPLACLSRYLQTFVQSFSTFGPNLWHIVTGSFPNFAANPILLLSSFPQ